jgi:hyperosmotically inducible periplasmic protein
MKRILPVALCVLSLAACSTTAKTTPDVADGIRKTLERNNLKDVSVSQDRDKGVITLTGHTLSDADKALAESLAKQADPAEIVANEIVVTPPGMESDAKKISSSLDNGIEDNLKAALLKEKVDAGVDYKVVAGVVTLTGKVDTVDIKKKVGRIASEVPNVKEVVNDLRVK